ncbi:MAG TPA: PD-(D/E)XK nuclease family protein, partial [Thermoanaerobaculia bacterium]|nr:PD-(D/E)XK nuclease family protein [Thermoanaerobaculia bacterium]
MARKTEQPFLPFDAPAPPPEPPPAASRLISALAAACAEAPLVEKVLVAPSLLTGHTLVERLAREGHPWTNLRVETVRTLALAAAGPGLVRDGLRLLSRAQALALVEQACAQALGPRSYFGALRGRTGLHRAIQRTLDELRAAGIGPSGLPTAAFADRRKAAELRRVLAGYDAALAEGRYVDSLGVLTRAAAIDPPAGASTLLLLPSDAELSELERLVLERLAGDRLRSLPVDEPAAWSARAASAELFRAIGEENEIREVFRRCLARAIPWDSVEILHTDEKVYPALAWELSREHGIPCTFAGGIPVTYSRPGQAALAFLAWIAEGFAADRLREALASGAASLRRLDAPADAPPAGSVAREIRRARIGWGRRRHLSALDRHVRDLEGPERPSRRDEPADDEPAEERSVLRARRLAAARLARAFAARALELAPPEGSNDPMQALARGAGTFVAEFARVTDDFDAAAGTALETLFREIAELPAAPVSIGDALERLRDAVGEIAVLADRPRPGHLHVGAFTAGGHSGRAHTFLLGLDETRHPGRDLEDPVLLDEERRRINDALERPLLAIERERPREQALALQSCVARLRGRLTASYSKFDIRNLSQAGEPAPSPFFLELYRAKTGTNADYGDMLAALPPPAGFVPAADAALDESEWWLARLAATDAAPGSAAPLVRRRFPWLEDGRVAVSARASDDFTLWDGRLAAPAPELDPRRSGAPTSASLVQSLAGCPFAYFVRNVLRVRPPDDLERDSTRWLEPRDEGNLLHEVFRTFLEGLTRRGEKPDARRHADALFALAEERIADWRERVPPSSEVAFQSQRETILHACRTFLAAESDHCRGVTPRWFEVGFGMREVADGGIASAEPVEIPLGRGERVRLRGSIDRVDEAADGAFHVWDYKTGSAAGIQEGRGLHGGRQAQPALYAMAFETLLKRSGREGRVAISGYFFPGRKGEGQRMSIAVDAAETGRALARLFDLAGAGFFPHATSKNGCKFCDFEAVCGDRAR